MPNHLTLAVAGGRKTQGLVDYCREATGRKIAVLTFTQTNQQEIRSRLASQAGDCNTLEDGLVHFFAAPFRPAIPAVQIP